MTDDVRGSDAPDGWPPDDSSGGGLPDKLRNVGIGVGVLVGLGVGWFAFQWFFCRIEVPAGHLGVLIAKTGENLRQGQIAARSAEQKGIQVEPLKPGRHFRNPLFWDWRIEPIIEVPPRSVGVLTRIYGESPDLQQNLLVPRDSKKKGIVEEALKPGLHEKLNPMLYDVELHEAVEIEPGYVGVVCRRVGNKPETPNSYMVGAGERGVQRRVLSPGIHYLNPYRKTVYRVDVRSQRLELAAEPAPETDEEGATGLSALRFPSSDGFEIEVKLTVEWSIQEERAPEVFVRIGAGEEETLLQNVLRKTLIPALRGNARIEGSKYPAVDYISGESRTAFQVAISKSLKADCEKQGVIINSVMVNDIVPPQEIAAPIREREVAKEELARNEVQVKQAKADQSLARQTELIEQESEEVKAETKMKRRKIGADNAQDVALIEQEQLLEVAKADLDAARLQAKAIKERGRAEADVIIADNEARAEALKRSVEAFGEPGRFASYTFARHLAPRVRSVFADPEGPFGALFQDLLEPPEPEGAGGSSVRRAGEDQ